MASTADFDLVVREARLPDGTAPVDIGVRDGMIATIADAVGGAGDVELDADGGLVAPGLVDSHVHMDKAFAGDPDSGTADWTRPKYNDNPFTYGEAIETGLQYFQSVDPVTIEENAVRHGLCAVAAGTRHIRTHVTVDPAYGVRTVEAVDAARERLCDVLDVEIVAYSERGVLDDATQDILADCIEAGADLVGGMDPGTVDGDVDSSIDAVYEVAADAGVGVDSHIHETGSLGVHSIQRMAARAEAYGLTNSVTVSHAYALSDADDDLAATLRAVAVAGLDIVVCHQSVRPTMPLRGVLEEGISTGVGTDNIRDFVFPNGDADLVKGLERLIARLNDDPTDNGYRSWSTNDALRTLFTLATTGGAGVLGVDDYGLVEGTPADFVVFDAPSPEWAILGRGRDRTVVAGGRVAADGGRLEPWVRSVTGYDGLLV